MLGHRCCYYFGGEHFGPERFSLDRFGALKQQIYVFCRKMTIEETERPTMMDRHGQRKSQGRPQR